MLFKRKGSLREEYNQKLLHQLGELKEKWQTEKKIADKCFDLNEELEQQVKLTEIKYLYLLREAKSRNIRLATKNHN